MAPAYLKPPPHTARSGEAVFVARDEAGDFAIGVGRVKIASDDFLFVNGVAADLGQLAHSSEGEEVLRRGDAIGKTILIKKADPPTDPPNAWIVPDDLAAATGNGAGCGSTIVYDPSQWPRRGDPRSPSSNTILLTMLRQANLNASGKSDPASPDWGDK